METAVHRLHRAGANVYLSGAQERLKLAVVQPFVVKPKWSPAHPLAAKALGEYREMLARAGQAPPVVENAVLSVWGPGQALESRRHVGSGVILVVRDNYFLLSASHVFDQMRDHSVLVGSPDEGRLVELVGERFSSVQGPSGTHQDDPVDASALHIQGGLTAALKKKAIGTEILDFAPSPDSMGLLAAAGFPVKRAGISGTSTWAHQGLVASFECSSTQYAALQVDPRMYLAMVYEDHWPIKGQWQKSPIPRGFSGGAIIRFEGVSARGFSGGTPQQLLRAIVIEHRPGKKNQPGVLVSTRIGVHCGLIAKYMPDLAKATGWSFGP